MESSKLFHSCHLNTDHPWVAQTHVYHCEQMEKLKSEFIETENFSKSQGKLCEKNKSFVGKINKSTPHSLTPPPLVRQPGTIGIVKIKEYLESTEKN